MKSGPGVKQCMFHFERHHGELRAAPGENPYYTYVVVGGVVIAKAFFRAFFGKTGINMGSKLDTFGADVDEPF